MAYLSKHANKQQGVVLITALIMVIAVTGIAVTLMSSSSVDIKITNAAQEREVAENELIGEVSFWKHTQHVLQKVFVLRGWLTCVTFPVED